MALAPQPLFVWIVEQHLNTWLLTGLWCPRWRQISCCQYHYPNTGNAVVFPRSDKKVFLGIIRIYHYHLPAVSSVFLPSKLSPFLLKNLNSKIQVIAQTKQHNSLPYYIIMCLINLFLPFFLKFFKYMILLWHTCYIVNWKSARLHTHFKQF